MNIVVLGLSLSSSWGNGHATTYRALLGGLAGRGHDILFLERRQPWYQDNRDLWNPDWCELEFYDAVADLFRYSARIADADAVIIGSYVPDGITVGLLVRSMRPKLLAFYDIDTPVTLAALSRDACSYLAPYQVSQYDLYLSFTGGPLLKQLVRRHGAPRAFPLYCSVDPALYHPVPSRHDWDLGYLGTYSDDRQPGLETLLIQAARREPGLRFVVAGSLYPDWIDWPANVTRIEHVPPAEHALFYSRCRYSLNVTRRDMREAGYSPSVRLFEAASCGSALISDSWPGLDSILEPGREIALTGSTDEVLAIVKGWPDARREDQARRARARVLSAHTGAVRARELEMLLEAVGNEMSGRVSAPERSLDTAVNGRA